MMKTAILFTATVLGVSTPAGPTVTSADPTILTLPAAEKVIAQFSYLELSHGVDGFGFSVTDKTDVFVDVEFPGDLHIRIGF
jgi:hypothetical protein